MNALVKSFGDAARVNFAVTQSDESRDELGILNQAFNEICAEMREALNKVEKEQAEKRRAEIRMLQAQINPHFLFNTLDSLRFTSMMNNVPVVSDGLAALSHLLRSPIHNGLQRQPDNLLIIHQNGLIHRSPPSTRYRASSSALRFPGPVRC